MTPYALVHRGMYVADNTRPRYLCPCQCGRLLNADVFEAIAGCTPDVYRAPLGRFIDPSDATGANVEHRSPR